MSLKEEFQDLGMEMAQIIKKEIDRMKTNLDSSLKYIQEETKRKIAKDLVKMEQTLVQRALFDLNKKISDKVNQINRNVLSKKTQLINDFIKILLNEINSHIKNNPKGYFNYLSREIKNALSMFQSDAIIFFNSRDRKIIEKEPEFSSILTSKLTVSTEPIETICGFKIQAKDGSFIIDYTFESRLEQIKENISMRFMQIFPILDIKIDNASTTLEEIRINNSGETQ